MHKLLNGDCLEVLKSLDANSVDLVVTSPPYDNIKNYNKSNAWSFDIFKKAAIELVRVIKNGACIVWVVADQTCNGSESGSSFRQALYFKEIGLNIHDTMIYKKLNYTPLTHRRYEQEFEFIFVLSKGKPTTFNPIMVPCKYAGTSTWGSPKYYKTSDDFLTKTKPQIINSEKIKGNIFEYRTGSLKTGKIKHPAMFPLELALDQINSWSNTGDTVLDPFMGSGQTGIAAKKIGRKFIGIEKEKEYFEIATARVNATRL